MRTSSDNGRVCSECLERIPDSRRADASTCSPECSQVRTDRRTAERHKKRYRADPRYRKKVCKQKLSSYYRHLEKRQREARARDILGRLAIERLEPAHRAYLWQIAYKMAAKSRKKKSRIPS